MWLRLRRRSSIYYPGKEPRKLVRIVLNVFVTNYGSKVCSIVDIRVFSSLMARCTSVAFEIDATATNRLQAPPSIFISPLIAATQLLGEIFSNP